MELRSHEGAVRTAGGVVSSGKLIVEQESEARVTVRIQTISWDGACEVGQIEIDLARHLDPRVSIRISRLDERSTGPIEVSMA